MNTSTSSATQPQVAAHKPQFTPGPWVAHQDTLRYAGQENRLLRWLISTPKNERGGVRKVAVLEGPFESIPQAEANAKLIAASPDLVEALQNLTKSMSEYKEAIGGDYEISVHMALRADKCLDEARAALAKALS